MSTHKTAELIGPLLDAAVALAEGIRPYNFRNKWCLIVDEGEDETKVYEPSIDWELGGPMIERERIELSCKGASCKPSWEALIAYGNTNDVIQIGPTPLIAAMRAYVASKFGAEVELPC